MANASDVVPEGPRRCVPRGDAARTPAGPRRGVSPDGVDPVAASHPPETGLNVPVWKKLLRDASFRERVRRRLVAVAFPVHRCKEPLAVTLRKSSAGLQFTSYLSKARWQRVEDRARAAQRAARDIVEADSQFKPDASRSDADVPSLLLDAVTSNGDAVHGWLLRWWEMTRRHWLATRESGAESDVALIDRSVYIRLHVAFHHPLLYAHGQGDWGLPAAEVRGAERLAEADWKHDAGGQRSMQREQVCNVLWKWAAAWVESASTDEVCELLHLCYEQLATFAEDGSDTGLLPAPRTRSPTARALPGEERVYDEEEDLSFLTAHERGLLGLLSDGPEKLSDWYAANLGSPTAHASPTTSAGTAPEASAFPFTPAAAPTPVAPAPTAPTPTAPALSDESRRGRVALTVGILAGAAKRLDDVDPGCYRDALVRLPGARRAPMQTFVAEQVAMHRIAGKLSQGQRVVQGGAALLRYLANGSLPSYSVGVLMRRTPETVDHLRSALRDGVVTETLAQPAAPPVAHASLALQKREPSGGRQPRPRRPPKSAPPNRASRASFGSRAGLYYGSTLRRDTNSAQQ
eukprot:TRINITY_DN5251_c0_g1_i2.p1 TRINITY_DN5251_c0_g1~~TRINITY_DN5251_c0_g1_i2.p1  ORF type:complete len:591 (+),score=148.00 TRINITY_DN5251_c0_g1_i2:48-1775(+)